MNTLNWKTTISGVVAGLSQIAKAFNLDVPPVVWDVVSGIALIICGFFSKDKNVTGGTTPQ